MISSQEFEVSTMKVIFCMIYRFILHDVPHWRMFSWNMRSHSNAFLCKFQLSGTAVWTYSAWKYFYIVTFNLFLNIRNAFLSTLENPLRSIIVQPLKIFNFVENLHPLYRMYFFRTVLCCAEITEEFYFCVLYWS